MQGNFLPRWSWELRLLDGNLAEIRETINAGSALPPAVRLWGKSPFPVPRGLFYPSGLPGRAISEFPAQQVQRFGDESELNLVIPESTTVCLWATWKQLPVAASMFSLKDDAYYPGETWSVYPLGPSFGHLIGYMQPNSSDAARAAARKW
jgi:hypothetical protein